MPVTRADSRPPRAIDRARRLVAAAGVLLMVAACGGGGGGGSSSAAQVRVVNATRSHASVDLLSSATVVAPAVAVDTASPYVGVGAGSSNLQINDAGTSTALATLSPTVAGGLHYSVVTYETNGRVGVSVINDDITVPATGTATLRVLDAAPDAGAIDIYVTDPAASLASLTPTFTVSTTTATVTTTFVSFAAGTYRIRVTGQGNANDLRLDIPSVTLASQEVGTIVVTGTVGGVLVDGGVLAQQGAYAATRNPNARVRLAAAVSGGASVGATAGAAVVSPPATSPAIGSYAVVPAANALAVTVNGVTVPGVIAAPAAGSDSTLLVYGDPAAPTVTLVADDNHLPSSSSLFKIRMINGLTGNAPALTLTADFSPVASNVLPGTASPYGTATGSSSVRLDVTSATSFTPLFTDSGLNLPANAVFTMFVLGDAATPQHALRRDR